MKKQKLELNRGKSSVAHLKKRKKKEKSLEQDVIRGITQKQAQPCPGGLPNEVDKMLKRSKVKIVGMLEVYAEGQDHSQAGDILRMA